jgi:hypothetical protein
MSRIQKISDQWLEIKDEINQCPLDSENVKKHECKVLDLLQFKKQRC